MPKGVYERKVRQILEKDDHIIVPLTRGKVAIIFKEDKHIVEGFNWCVLLNGGKEYAVRNCYKTGKRVFIYMHSQIKPPSKGMQTDHIDGDSLNNRRNNLRDATNQENGRNRRKNNNNTSGYKGVSWHRLTNKWLANIRHNGIKIHIGLYENIKDAALAYDAAARELHGDFARPNFPDAEPDQVSLS